MAARSLVRRWRAVQGLTVCTRAQHCRHSSHIIQSPFKHLDIPNKLIQDMIWETVDRFPDSIAVKCGLTGRAYSFSQLMQLSQRLATSLRHSGFIPRDVIAVVLPNCPEFAVVTLGALEADLVLSFVNHAYTADEICHQLRDSGSVCVVTAAGQLNTVLSAINKVEHITRSKQVRRVVVMDIPSPGSLPQGVTRFSEMVADGVEISVNKTSQVLVDDVAFLPYSSGTTGLAKGVCLSHRNIVSNILQVMAIDGLVAHTPDQGWEAVLGVLPFYHIYGLVMILLKSIVNGIRVVDLPKFEQDSFLQTLKNEKVTHAFLVPPLILFLGNSAKVKAEHLEHVRYIICGAAPIGASDMEKVKEKGGNREELHILQGYGMTESSPLLCFPKVPCHDLATVGFPVSNTCVRVVDPNTGQLLGPNQLGELHFKGPQMMLRYHNNPKATADTLDEEGWLKTGDIGYYNENSQFYVKDRIKELIKVKGFQVPPAELEEVLRSHPLVSDVAVIGVPCPQSGEVPVAYIVGQKDKKPSSDEIKQFLSEKVSRHKQVSEVIFIDTIPKSAAGKILRKELKHLYTSSH